VVATRRLKALTELVESRLHLPPGPLLVALSGGADSASLAWLAARHRSVRAVHIHHGLPASNQLETAAKAIADLLGIPLEVRQIRLGRFSEAEARSARYREFDSVGKPAEWIVTGHTSDDQAETVLANLLRGAGLDGLAGIPERRGNVARPLLSISRSETRELATLAQLPWIDDPANLEEGPLRNRIRLELIPQLESEYNPGLRRHLAAAAQAIAEGGLVPIPIGEAIPSGWRVPAGVLWALGRTGAISSLRKVVGELRAGYGLDRAEAERVWAVVSGGTSATELTGGLRISRSGPWVELTHHQVD
jgi:tRNA(Ile)-lysidine synthetase-like protein